MSKKRSHEHWKSNKYCKKQKYNNKNKSIIFENIVYLIFNWAIFVVFMLVVSSSWAGR